MPDRPAVSVCMPAHRDSQLFREALQSVLSQPVGSLEVIVSDDSGGGLEQAAHEPGDERVRYVANPQPLGFVANHRAALDAARGELLAILHDDDRWLPGYLPAMTAPFHGDPQLGMVC